MHSLGECFALQLVRGVWLQICDTDVCNYNINNTEAWYKSQSDLQLFFLVSLGFGSVRNGCVYTKYRDFKNVQLLRIGFL